MVKLIILFRTGKHSEDWYESYNRFLMMLEDLPGLRRKAVSNAFGAMGPGVPYSMVVEAWFDHQAALQTALTSPPGVEAGELLLRFAGNDFIALYADTLEEAIPPAGTA